MTPPPNTQSGEDARNELHKQLIMKIGYVRFEGGLEAWMRISRDVTDLIAARESSLLDEVEKRVIGEDERGLRMDMEGSVMCEIHGGYDECTCDAQNELREQQRVALTQLRQERGLASQRPNTKHNEEAS